MVWAETAESVTVKLAVPSALTDGDVIDAQGGGAIVVVDIAGAGDRAHGEREGLRAGLIDGVIDGGHGDGEGGHTGGHGDVAPERLTPALKVSALV
jgi:hypothetical protein